MSKDGVDLGLLSLPTMVRWFSPSLLANAAGRAIISPIFGTFADARSMQAFVDGFGEKELAQVTQRYRFKDEDLDAASGVVWVDYISDTGDGFDSTYAMASLVAAEKLIVGRKGSKETYDLPSGKLLLLGGDQVYPYPSRDEYRDRFETPYRMAFPAGSPSRDAFVVPGNHDWYDGLNAFDYLFCQARFGVADGSRIGNLRFPQHRSYFAIRLPHNWWIWGCDIQFSQYLDAGQVRYFSAVAEGMKRRQPGEPEHKIVVLTAEPGWQYEAEEARAANSNLEIITGIVAGSGAKICAVLAGDSHHYCRYFSKDLGLNLITAGGGGAFLHPTHQLQDQVQYNWVGQTHTFNLHCRPRVGGGAPEAAVFPSRHRSFWLTWGNVLFPFWNYTFATLLGTLYWIMTWMYSQAQIPRVDCSISQIRENIDKVVEQSRPLIEDILVYNTRTCGLRGTTLVGKLEDLVGITLQAGVHQFLLGMFGLVLFFVLYSYADAKRWWKKLLMGSLHWLAHISAMIGLYLIVNHFGYWTWFGTETVRYARPFVGELANVLRTVAYTLQMIFGGGIVAGLVWGLYLFVSCAFFRRHWNDAFSALRSPDFKNFLRLKLEPDRLTIFAIGLRRVPTRIEWQWRTTHGQQRLEPLFKLSPELVDDPIVIEASKVRMETSAARSDGLLT